MTTTKEIKIPDIGTATNVEVIEIMVAPGDEVAKDDSLITIESEKSSMEIPSPEAGVIKSISIKIGDKVSEGDPILVLEVAGETKSAEPKIETTKSHATVKDVPAIVAPAATASKQESITTTKSTEINASPGVRKLARELGIDLNILQGSGRKDRITKEDLQTYIKRSMTQGSGSFSMPEIPVVDFAKFGEIERKTLTKIKKLTGVHVHRSWITIPHVTQFDEADITELENFRVKNKDKAEKQGAKLTPLVFIMKAVVAALRRFPTFNASLDPSGEELILKKYFNLGVAVDTPNGLVVPVIRDVDKKGMFELAIELAKISAKAREKGLTPTEMQGSCFTISSLGGISGTAFTPIVNAPDVAILGVSKAQMKPIYQNNNFVPRLMLPLSLSYDHRVIDGAEGARFTAYLAEMLGDIRGLLL